MVRGLVGTLLVAALLLATSATAQDEALPDILERHLVQLEKSWAASLYIRRSVRNIQILEYSRSDNASVISARYDYRMGDSTASDTVYITFRDGYRTCVAYRFYNKYCTLTGARDGSP